MEKLKMKLEDDIGADPMNNMPAPKFTKQILKSVIGENRANQVLQSMSMSIIPKVGGGSMTSGLTECKCPAVFLSFRNGATIEVNERYGKSVQVPAVADLTELGEKNEENPWNLLIHGQQ